MKPLFFAALFALLSGCYSGQHKSDAFNSDRELIHLDPTIAVKPVADKKMHWRVIHGDSVLDNYYWMFDYFGKGPDSTKAVDYLKAENAYLDTVMNCTKKLQADLFQEMKARIRETDEDVPAFKNGYFYYKRTETGKQYYKYCRKKGSMHAKEELLLDIDKMAEGGAYFSVSGLEVSKNNKLLAYAVDEVSRLQYTIHVKNLETGELLKDEVKNAEGNICWANDNQTFFYTSKNPVSLITEKIKRHQLGTPERLDAVVYNEKDNTNYITVSKSKNDNYILISSKGLVSSETWMLDASQPTAAFKVFQPRIKNVIYTVKPLADRFLILTNKDNAYNYKIMECPLDKTYASHWKEFIPHRQDVLIENMAEFNYFIAIQERKNTLVNMHFIHLRDKTEQYVHLDEAAYSMSMEANPEYDCTAFRYTYSSFITPTTIAEYDILSKKKKLLKQDKVNGYDAKNYTTERLTVSTADETNIPLSIVYKKGFKRDGSSPLLLYAYGGYGYTIDASFNSTILSLLDRGFAYAIAHVRGGQDLGYQWYEDAKMLKKKNSITDFIACSQYLINQKYTSSKHLYASGESGGGLIMGAIANSTPDLFKGIIAQVPIVDILNSMLDERIPLTTNEFDEWGNPKNKEIYFYMKDYTPYENVKAGNYPNLLVIAGLHDSQVQYFEPEKWVAKVRGLKKDNNLMLLKTNMDSGHGGASGRFDYLKDIAFNYTFLLGLEGIQKTE